MDIDMYIPPRTVAGAHLSVFKLCLLYRTCVYHISLHRYASHKKGREENRELRERVESRKTEPSHQLGGKMRRGEDEGGWDQSTKA